MTPAPEASPETHGLRWVGPDLEPVEGTPRPTACWSRGHAVLDDGRSLEGAEIARYLARAEDGLEPVLATLNGCFAAVVVTPTRAVLVTDRFGTIPIHLDRRGEVWWAAPDPWSLLTTDRGSCEPDPQGVVELLRYGYVLGTRTVVRGLSTLAPGTVKELRGGRTTETRWWTYGYHPAKADPEEAAERLVAVLDSIAARTSAPLLADGRRVGLTLSGGLDSRVLAAVFAEQRGLDPVALSYGLQGDPEVEVAGAVARALDMEHRVGELDATYLDDAFLERSVREVGLTTRFTCGVGVRHLPTEGVDVLVPGHTGDFVSGGHLPVHVGMVRSKRDLVAYLDFAHGRFLGSDAAIRGILRFDARPYLRAGLHESIGAFDPSEDVLGLVDRWNVENRQRRLILMELRAYEACADWRLPFYDHELIDFFRDLPHELRLGQRLYVEAARDRLFQRHDGALDGVPRVGGGFRVDATLPARLATWRRRQPLSGWALRFVLPAFRDLSRRLRPRPNQVHGTDLFQAWYGRTGPVRDFIRERVDRLPDELFDREALRRLLDRRGNEERIYSRLLVGVLTVDEALRQARSRPRSPLSARPT